jgi:hypothetical protein
MSTLADGGYGLIMKQMQKRGIVAKVAAQNCIILTPDGTYDKIPLPTRPVLVGAEILYHSPRFAWPLKTILMVACLLIIFMSYPLINEAMLPQAAAYVSLDINSSLEMAVDKNMRVIDVKCFDDEASNLIESLDLEGKSLPDALAEVVNQAAAQNYLISGQENLMISTISPSGSDPASVDEALLYGVLEDSMTSRGYSGEVKIYTANQDFHQAAADKKMSAGKYLVYEQLVRSGRNVSETDLKQYSVSEMADNYQVNFLPNYKNITIHAPSTNLIPEITVEDNGKSVAIEDYLNSHDSKISDRQDSKYPANNSVSRSYPARQTRDVPNIATTAENSKPESVPGKSYKKSANTKIDDITQYITGKSEKIKEHLQENVDKR